MTDTAAKTPAPPRPVPPPLPAAPARAAVTAPAAPPAGAAGLDARGTDARGTAAFAPAVTPAPAALQPAAQRPGEVRRPANPAWIRLRHRLILLSFILIVLLPPLGAAVYLWGFAADQYHSKVGFSVRLEEGGSALGLLSGLTGISNSSSSDTDILFEFIQSQKLVADMDAELDLRRIWAAPGLDPVFTLAPDATLEDLVQYWNGMVHLTRGKSAGLLEIEVRAFTPQDATRIATALFDRSSQMINQLSDIAREDAIRFARADLDEALDRLKTAREAMTRFRNINQIVNPESDIQSQAGLLANLHSQQAATLIELDLLRDTVPENDPRVTQAERRLQVIETRIDAERGKFGLGPAGQGNAAFADLVGEYERLTVDREFAERAYVTAMASYDAAIAEARRQSRYLAAYMEPTTAQSSIYPRRLTLLLTLTIFLGLGWTIGLLIYYSAKDRR